MTEPIPPPTKPIGERINIVPPPPPPALVQERDAVPSGRVVVTFLVAVVVIAVSIVVVIGLEQHPQTHADTKTAPALLYGVHQTPIAGPSYAAALRAKQESALHAPAIVDQQTGFRSIPIEDAKRIYVAQHAPHAAQTQQTPRTQQTQEKQR